MDEKRKDDSDVSDTCQGTLDEGYAILIVENGEVYCRDKRTGEVKKLKEYIIRKDRDIKNPIIIGREHPETTERNDILLSSNYEYASRHHCEIFFDESKNSYFLVDCSLNGTFVNGERVGGNRVNKSRKLEHNDLIEIPTSKEGCGNVQLRFVMHKRNGLIDWIKGKLTENP
jgi:hypothetical protein